MVPVWFQRSGDVERGQERGVIVGRVIVVPGEAGAVHKDGACGGDGLVVVYQEGEVGHCLVAAVCGDLECGCGGVGTVDGVDAEVVGSGEGVEPGRVTVCGDARDHQGGFGGFAQAGAFSAGGLDGRGGFVADVCPWERFDAGGWAVEEEEEDDTAQNGEVEDRAQCFASHGAYCLSCMV